MPAEAAAADLLERAALADHLFRATLAAHALFEVTGDAQWLQKAHEHAVAYRGNALVRYVHS
jgi:hypothetical protein